MKLLEGPKKSFILVDYTLLLLAVVGNCLVLGSVSKLRFGLTGYRQFLLSLLGSDLFICGVNLISFIYHAASLYTSNNEFAKVGADIIRSLQLTGFIANLLNLSGMSVDHYIGIINPLRYNQILSKKYVRLAVSFIWILSFSLGFADFTVSTVMESLANDQRNRVIADAISSGVNGTSGNALETILMLVRLFTTGPTVNSLDHSNQFAFPSNSNVFEIGDQDFNVSFYPTSPKPTMQYLHDDTSSSESHENMLGAELLSGDTFRQLEVLIASLLNSTNQAILSDSFETMVQEMNDTLDPEPLIGQIINMKRQKRVMSYSRSANKVWLEFAVMSLTIVCFVFLTFCYGRIFREVSIKFSSSGTNTRRIVITTFLMLGSFTICWLPFMTFELIMIYEIRTSHIEPLDSSWFFAVHNAFNTLLMCSPLLDPIIYAWRMRIVRKYILVRYLQCLPCIGKHVERMKARNSYASIFAGSTAPPNSLQHQRGSVTRASFYVQAARNVFGAVYLDRDSFIPRSSAENFLFLRRATTWYRRRRDEKLRHRTSTMTSNSLRPIHQIPQFNSFDLSTICKFIDEDEDDGASDCQGFEIADDNVFLVRSHSTPNCLQTRRFTNENNHQNLLKENFLTVPGQAAGVYERLVQPNIHHQSYLQRSTSSPGDRREDLLLETRVDADTNEFQQRCCSSSRRDLRPIFRDSEAVFARFRHNSFNLLGPGAYGRESVTLNCPTINY